MFKYGSFRLFIAKIFFGGILIILGSVYTGSLFTYNIDDPGFQTLTNNIKSNEINNFFGLFGSQLSSYSFIFIGHLSYLLSFLIIIEGVKIFIGFKSGYIYLKFVSNIFSILFLGYFLQSYSFNNLSSGLISEFTMNIFNNFIGYYINNKVLTHIINIIILIIGLYLLIISYSLKTKRIYKVLFIFKLFYYLKYLRIILPSKNYYNKLSKKNKIYNKSEPTFNKNNYKRLVNTKKTSSENYKQLDIDNFKFSLPSIKILNKSSNKRILSKEFDRINTEAASKLEKTLSEYGVDGKIVGFKTGPIVTLFEFIPNAGIKSSKVIGLSDDIARAMSSYSARISSQPGKTSLGIEIPNTKRDNVFFGDLIDDEEFDLNDNSLQLALGKDISGEKIYADLEKMPHLLIAGTTGSGKSVGINTMILSILYKFKPNDCKLILIDPKMLELSIYEDIPHLLTPVVTDPKKAVFALKWVVREMENRYKLMSSVNVKNIESYNNKVLKTLSSGRKLFREVQTGIDPDTRMPIVEKMEINLEKMPFIVVVIDEMADLMMVAGKEVETLVQRLAQMARASGIHLITATQRPSVDVITGTIKANFPSRISYKVASKFDSRTILNEMGAEQLLGSGDMLFLENGGNIKRLHGGFVSESEVENVVNSIKSQATFDYTKEISLKEDSETQNAIGDLVSNNNDELYNKAVEIVIKQQKVSTSYIQRYLQIGYNRAARIVEKMEEDGIITEASNAGKRHVLKKQ